VAHRERDQLEIKMNEQQLLYVRVTLAQLQLEHAYMQMVNDEARIVGGMPSYKSRDLLKLMTEMTVLRESVAQVLPLETIAA
jgi:uncharacterized protein YpiB (UPF0302 family)